MNLVGKIFIVLVAVMSLVFAAMSVMVYGIHTNWRQLVINPTEEPGKPLGLQFALKNANDANTALKNQLSALEDSYKSQLNEREQRLAKLETETKELARLHDEAVKDRDSKDASARELAASLAAKQTNEAALIKERDVLREDARGLREDRDRQFKLVVQRTDEMHEAVAEVKRLAKRNEELAADLIHARDILTRLGVDGNIDPNSLVPPVDGVVTAVQGADLIQISLGSDQGLRRGHRLEVYRMNGTASQYLGKVVVETVQPNLAVCRVLPEYRQGPIQYGDRVAAKIQ
jgi:hypothetical protein